MKKFGVFLLLAATAMPAMAAADGEREGRHHRSEQSQSSDSSSSERGGGPSFGGRQSGGDESRTFQRAERVERVRGEGGGESPFGGMRRRESQQQQQQVQAPQQVQVAPQVVMPGNDDSVRNYGRRYRDRAEGRPEPVFQQPQQQQPQPGTSGWQGRQRHVRTIPDNSVEGRFGATSPERPASTIERRHRDGYRDRNVTQWSQHWRNDNRYDWRRYRDHNRSRFHIGFYFDPFGWNYRRFSIGSYMWPSYYSSRYWINDPWMYRLPPAYGPYRWVRYHNDALLIDTWSGEVVDVIWNFFW